MSYTEEGGGTVDPAAYYSDWSAASIFDTLGNSLGKALDTYVNTRAQIALIEAGTPAMQGMRPTGAAVVANTQGVQVSSGMLLLIGAAVVAFVILKD